jgi:stress response protein SCP2
MTNTGPVGLNFTKVGDNVVEDEGNKTEDVFEAPLLNDEGKPIEKLRVELRWTQPQLANRTEGGKFSRMMGGLINSAREAEKKTDVDANAVLFVGDEDVEFAGPDNLVAAEGFVQHGGNVISGDNNTPEVLRIDLKSLATDPRTRDFTAIAITASCFKGDFTKVTGCRVTFIDDTNGAGQVIDQIRFGITANQRGGLPNNAALVAAVVKEDGVFRLRKGIKTYGRATDWRGLAPICRDSVAV